MPTLNVDVSSSGDTTLVAAPVSTSWKIRVIGLDLTSNSQVVVTLKDGDGNVLWTTLAMNASTGGGIVLPPTKKRDIDCAAGKLLKINLSGAVRVGGSITYRQVPYNDIGDTDND